MASVALECCLTGHLIIDASVSCEILSHPQESCHQFTSRGLYHQSADTVPSHHCHWCLIALNVFLAPNYILVSGFLSNSGHSPCVHSQLVIFLTNYASVCLDIINLRNSKFGGFDLNPESSTLDTHSFYMLHFHICKLSNVESNVTVCRCMTLITLIRQ